MAKYEDIYKLSQEANNENMSPLQAQLANQYASADRTYAETVGMAEQARQNAVYDAQNAYKTNLSNYGRAAETALGNGMRGSGYSSYADVAAFNAQRGEVAVANSKYADAVRQAQYAADQQKYAANDSYEKGLQGSYDNLANLAMQGALSKDEILKMAGNAGITNAGQLDTLGTLASKSYDEVTRVPMLEDAYNAGLQGDVLAYNQLTDDEAKKRVVDGVIDSVNAGNSIDLNKIKAVFGDASDIYKKVDDAVTTRDKAALVGAFDALNVKNAVSAYEDLLKRTDTTDAVKDYVLDQFLTKYGDDLGHIKRLYDAVNQIQANGYAVDNGIVLKILKSADKFDARTRKAYKMPAARGAGFTVSKK